MPLNYEQIFGDDFIPILQAIEKGLPDQVETMLLGQIDKMIFEVSIFSDNITKTVASLSASGVKPAQIQNIIGNDMAGGGKIFGGLRNSVKEEIVNGMNQASRLGQYEEYGPRDSYAWVTVGGHKICADCDSNEGAVKSHDKWVSEGLPGSGWSLCGGYCYCVLDPVGKIDSKVQAPKEIKPEKAATVRPKVSAWKKIFNSANIPANKAFQDTFQHANDKFKKFLSQLPQLRHIDSGTGGSYFSEAGLKIRGVSEASKKYARRYGRINMGGLDGAYNLNIIRHEFGHFIHHNIHHRGVPDYVINAMLKDWKLNKKLFDNNPKKYLKNSKFGEDWIKGIVNAQVKNNPGLTINSLYDSLEDLLKFRKPNQVKSR